MPAPGYSGTPLAPKLGIKPGHSVALLDGPPNFEALLEGLPEGVKFRSSVTAKASGFDVALVFVTTRAALERRVAECLGAMHAEAAVWVCWPKKSSGVATDVTEDTIREVALPQGLVDVKVCAVTDVWSALRLVIRKELRAAWSPGGGSKARQTPAPLSPTPKKRSAASAGKPVAETSKASRKAQTRKTANPASKSGRTRGGR